MAHLGASRSRLWLWLSLTLRLSLLLLLLLLPNELLPGLLLLHLDELLRAHSGFRSFGFDLLALEGLELRNCHATFLRFHCDHLLDLLRSEGLRARRRTCRRHFRGIWSEELSKRSRSGRAAVRGGEIQGQSRNVREKPAWFGLRCDQNPQNK